MVAGVCVGWHVVVAATVVLAVPDHRPHTGEEKVNEDERCRDRRGGRRGGRSHHRRQLRERRSGHSSRRRGGLAGRRLHGPPGSEAARTRAGVVTRNGDGSSEMLATSPSRPAVNASFYPVRRPGAEGVDKMRGRRRARGQHEYRSTYRFARPDATYLQSQEKAGSFLVKYGSRPIATTRKAASRTSGWRSHRAAGP